ncbi:MAG: translation initiation factor IF-1 [candidate division SR1 bacterium]|nr:MAG: translation initiation factor IF-1 [candidate division SR1 bacterium]
MVKDANVLEVDGEILETLPAGFFKVQLDGYDVEVRCKKSGKMTRSRISIIPGDRVKVELSMYDMTQGRIVFRYNPNKKNEES